MPPWQRACRGGTLCGLCMFCVYAKSPQPVLRDDCPLWNFRLTATENDPLIATGYSASVCGYGPVTLSPSQSLLVRFFSASAQGCPVQPLPWLLRPLRDHLLSPGCALLHNIPGGIYKILKHLQGWEVAIRFVNISLKNIFLILNWTAFPIWIYNIKGYSFSKAQTYVRQMSHLFKHIFPERSFDLNCLGSNSISQ